MGKRKSRSAYTSKGSRRSTVAGVREVRLSKTGGEKHNDKIKAWKAGKNPWITVPGTTTNMRFVKVRANTLYGDPKHARSNLFKKRGEE